MIKIRVNIDTRVGRIVQFFVLSDLILIAGWALVEPVFSIFIKENVRGATLITIGASAAIYWILRSLIQLPLARYLDRLGDEKKNFYVLIFGLIIASCSAVLFCFVREIWQLYLVQTFHAIGFALYVTAWAGIFSKHLDKGNVSFEWALDNTALTIASGVSGFLGSIVAVHFGFQSVFLIASFFSILAAATLMLVPNLVLPRKTTAASAGIGKHLK